MTIKLSTPKSTIRVVKPGDPDWNITAGLTFAPRAGFEISNDCPYEYRLIIQKCLEQSWVKPIANVYDRELTWEKLNEVS